MSLSQLGKRMGVSAQSVKEIEQRERSGGVSLKVLKTAAKAFDLKLTYGFSTQNKSLEYIIQKRAEALAKQIVLRTNKTMISEKQANSKVSLRKSIKEQTNEIIANKSKYLWD